MLKSIIIYNFSDINSEEGLVFNIPEPGSVAVISWKNGTWKTSLLKLVNMASSTRASQFWIKDCEWDLKAMHVLFEYIDDKWVTTKIRIRRKRDRFSYSIVDKDGKNSSIKFWHFEGFSKQINKKFLPAVWSRVSNLKDLIEWWTKKDQTFSKSLNDSIWKVLWDNSDIVIEKPKKWVSSKKRATEKWKTVDEMFLWKRALAEIFAELHSLEKWSIFIVDEVEQALHFDIHESLLKELISVAQDKEISVIVTTHSPYIFDKAPSSEKYLLRRLQSGIEIQQWAYLTAKEDLEAAKDRLIYITEDKKSEVILKKKLLLNKTPKKDIFIIPLWGASELAERIPYLDEIYKHVKDRYVIVYDPDIKETDINKFLWNVWKKKDRYKNIISWQYLVDLKWLNKIPERILLEFAFTSGFINKEKLESVYQNNTLKDFIPIISWLEKRKSTDNNSNVYKNIYKYFIEDEQLENDLLSSFLSQ